MNVHSRLRHDRLPGLVNSDDLIQPLELRAVPLGPAVLTPSVSLVCHGGFVFRASC